MKFGGMILLFLLLSWVTRNEACARFVGRQAMAILSRRTVGEVVTQTAQQVVNQATNQVASQVAKKSAVEVFKGLAKAAAKKSVETAGQAVVFGAVDAAGDAFRSSTQGDKTSSDLLKIQENQRALQLMQHEQEEKKIRHQKEMKELQLKELQLSPSKVSSVFSEELSSEQDDKRADRAGKRKDLTVHTQQPDVAEISKEDLPQWAIFMAYVVGSSLGFAGVLMAYSCCKFPCRASDEENFSGRKRARQASRF